MRQDWRSPPQKRQLLVYIKCWSRGHMELKPGRLKLHKFLNPSLHSQNSGCHVAALHWATWHLSFANNATCHHTIRPTANQTE
jgi:hypothetical protein